MKFKPLTKLVISFFIATLFNIIFFPVWVYFKIKNHAEKNKRKNYDVRNKLVICCTIILLLTVSLSGCSDNNGGGNTNTIPKTAGDISIACWNLQIFGPSKAENETLLDYYADKLDDHDVFIIQEIRDSTGMAIDELADRLTEYKYVISERAGKSSSKEQYALFYDEDLFTLRGKTDNTQSYQPMFQRPPFEVNLRVNNWNFTIFTIHTAPDYVSQELGYFESIVGNTDEDTILIGDFNADGSYYDEDNIQHFTDWKWVITNDEDTTVAASDNTYDRIIINEGAEDNYKNYGIMDDVVKSQSDHYLIYAIFSPGD